MGKKILILNGPNLNRLGLREPEFYGSTTLKQLEQELIEHAQKYDMNVTCYQTNHEGEMLDYLHRIADDNYDALVINPAAWTHTSIALRDALLTINISYILEIHISNIHNREDFRHKSYISDIATATICGLGTYGYFAAIDAINNNLTLKETK